MDELVLQEINEFITFAKEQVGKFDEDAKGNLLDYLSQYIAACDSILDEDKCNLYTTIKDVHHYMQDVMNWSNDFELPDRPWEELDRIDHVITSCQRIGFNISDPLQTSRLTNLFLQNMNKHDALFFVRFSAHTN